MNPEVEQALHAAMEHLQAGRTAEAERTYAQILAIDPTNFEALGNLGNAQRALGRLNDAEVSFRRALDLRPDIAELHGNLGTVLLELGRVEEARHCYEQALALKPGLAGAHYSLGTALDRLAQPLEAEKYFRQALALSPGYPEASNNLGNLYQRRGRHEDAEDCYRQALASRPDYAGALSNLLLHLNYVTGRSAADIYAEHREFDRRFGHPPHRTPHVNTPDPDRRIRVGYVSADLRQHSVNFFIEPVLDRHDRNGFESICYYSYAHADAVTERLKSLADRWRDVGTLDDETLTRLIREDSIDILVDLGGHTAHNRLLAFARKPAPVQATWLGYLNTTGLDAMDYRITDARATPEGPLDDLHSEKLLRLPDGQWCYRPPTDAPQICLPPSASERHITFGVFGNPAKIVVTQIALWDRLLARVPESRLMVIYSGLACVHDEMLERFASHGVRADRLTLLDMKPMAEYLALHGRIDVILDTFPYSGGTTTCHALWMGVPVVTLAGVTATSRGGASLLHAAGLDEMIAHTPEEYLEIAAALASDPGRLAALRAGMRNRLSASPLMDELRFTRNLENAYRAMWRHWCARQRA